MDLSDQTNSTRTQGKPLSATAYCIFLLGPAFFMATTFGSNQAGSFSFEPRAMHFVYGYLTIIPRFLVMELCTQLSAHFARRLSWPLWVHLIIGSVVGAQLIAPYTVFRNKLLEPYLSPGISFFETWPLRYSDPEYLRLAIYAVVPITLLWLVLNAVLINGFGYRRMGYDSVIGRPTRDNDDADTRVRESQTQSQHESSLSSELLWSRVPAELGRDLIGLQAQEHYTKVRTDLGEALVLMRFSDAIAAAEQQIPGLRVHRSHWIARRAIGGYDASSSSPSLVLTTGDRIPVSRSYRLATREAMSESKG